MFNVQLLSGVLSTKMRDCHLKITRNSPHERIIIFVTQFKDSSHIKEYAIGIYLFSELKHADADYNAGVEGHTSAGEQPLPMECTSSFSSTINMTNYLPTYTRAVLQYQNMSLVLCPSWRKPNLPILQNNVNISTGDKKQFRHELLLYHLCCNFCQLNHSTRLPRIYSTQ